MHNAHERQTAQMGNPRYIQTDQQSIFGDYLYDQIVPESHFLRKLNGLVEWTYYTKKLTKLYKGRKTSL